MNAAERRKQRRTTPIPNDPVPTPTDEDVTVVPTEAPPARPTLRDHLVSLGQAVTDLKAAHRLSEGAAVRVVEIGLQYLSNQRALDLQELSAKADTFPWNQPPTPDEEPSDDSEG